MNRKSKDDGGIRPPRHRIERHVEERLRQAEEGGLLRRELRQSLRELMDGGGEDDRTIDRTLNDALDALRSAGTAIARGKRWVATENLGLRTGRFERIGRRGYRVSEIGRRRRFEVGPRDIGQAHHGDLVLFREKSSSSSRGRRRDRSSGGGAEGAAVVESVVERATANWVGFLQKNRYGLDFRPFDHRLRFEARELDLERVARNRPLKGADLRRGLWVRLSVEQLQDDGGGSKSGRRRRGGDSRDDGGSRLVATSAEILGEPDEPNVETTVVLAAFEIPTGFGQDVLADAQTASLAEGEAPELPDLERKDFRSQVTFTIDGVTARDFDDALTIERLDDGYRLWVHIADVSHYVRPGTALDAEARRRGTSVYLADRAEHMLPSELSEGVCSLRPDEDRRAMTMRMDFDAEGHRTRSWADASWIRSDARLTYEEVDRFLDGDDSACPEEVHESLEIGCELAELLLERREERGAFEIEQPIGRFELDDRGQVREYLSSPRGFAHRLIEEFMIQANVAVAELLSEQLERQGLEGDDTTCLYRRHDPPKQDELDDLVREVEALGFEVPDGGVEDVGDLADILDAVGDSPQRTFVEALLLRSLMRAVYTHELGPHFALGLDAYCHFTSPIRRYPDLVVHRCLKAVVLDDRAHLPTGGSPQSAERLGEELSFLERRAEQAEREQFKWRMVRWLQKREGETFPATVSGIQPFGLFVLLEGFGMDGLIPFGETEWDPAVEETESGPEMTLSHEGALPDVDVRLGDQIDVRLLEANPVERRLTLGFARQGQSSRGGPARTGHGDSRRGDGGRRDGGGGQENRRRKGRSSRGRRGGGGSGGSGRSSRR